MGERRIFPWTRSFLQEPVTLLSVVEELVHHSLVSESSRISVSLDLSPSVYRIRVSDNGVGILDPHPLFRIKHSASVRVKSNGRIWDFSKGKLINREESEEGFCGTDVILNDFLYDHPVRQRLLKPYRDAEDVRLNVIIPYSIQNFRVKFILKEERKEEIIFSSPSSECPSLKVALLRHLSLMKIRLEESGLEEIKGSTSSFNLEGFISTSGIPDSKQQFLFLNDRFFRKTKCQKHIESLLKKSINLRASPCYFLHITCSEAEYELFFDSNSSRLEFVRWESLTKFLSDIILHFMSENRLVSPIKRRRVVGPCINGSDFAVSGIRRLESTTKNEDIRLLQRAMQQGNTPSQYKLLDANDGARVGLPARRPVHHMNIQSSTPKVMNRVLADDLIKIPVKEEDDLMSNARNVDIPETVTVRSQALKNLSRSTSASFSSLDKQDFISTREHFLFDDNIGQAENLLHDTEFPFSSTIAVKPLSGFNTMPRPETNLSGFEYNSERCETIPEYLDEHNTSTDGNQSLSLTAFNFTGNNSSSPIVKSLPNDKSMQRNLDDTEHIDVTSNFECLHRRIRSENDGGINRKKYKEFLVNQMKQIQKQLNRLRREDSSDEDTYSPVPHKKDVATMTSFNDTVFQSQMTTTFVKVVETPLKVEEEACATFGVFDNTLVYPEASVLKSSKIPKGWIKRKAENGEDVYIQMNSGFTTNRIEDIEKGVKFPVKKRLLDVVRAAGQLPDNNSLDDSQELNKDQSKNKSSGVSFLSESWKNPIFTPGKEDIPAIMSKPVGGNTVDAVGPLKFDKSVFDKLDVLYQLDKKLIVTLFDKTIIVILDQHAVHERIRLEDLIKTNYTDSSEVSSEELSSPIAVNLPTSEARLLKEYSTYMKIFGLQSLNVDSEDVMVFSHVPICFINRELNEIKNYRSSPMKELVLSLCKDIYNTILETGTSSTILPKTINDILNSQACKGAIKFGDHLTKKECESLITELKDCNLPFQCAHGRPSVAPIINLNNLKVSDAYRYENFKKINFKKLKYNVTVK